MWVSPFRHLRITGYLLLPEAFRSLSRLSSALSAKASALCPYCLTFSLRHPSVGGGGRLILIFDNLIIDVFLSLRLSPTRLHMQLIFAFISRIFDFHQIYMYAVFKVQS